MNENDYLHSVLNQYKAADLSIFSSEINELQETLKEWAASCYLNIFTSGSRAKGTAISLASDVDFMVSLAPNCNRNCGGLKSIYDSLHNKLSKKYANVRKQNVSVRITLRKPRASLFSDLKPLEIDITPAKKLVGNINDHALYVSQSDTWVQTNIQQHISDISNSGRVNEIKLLKVWRERNYLKFPSIYLEYLLVNEILRYKLKGSDQLEDNVFCVLSALAEENSNVLFKKIIDPANSNNTLSDLLSSADKICIKAAAKTSINKRYWKEIIY